MNMRYYMFGMDNCRSAECAKDLRGRGIDTVVGVSGACAEAAAREGLRVIACYGAFAGNADSPMAESASGEKGVWFGSGCPCDEENARGRIDAAIRVAKDCGAEEVWADGARFASPEPVHENFFSCFCPECMRRGAEAGFDMEKMRADVLAFGRTAETPVPAEWLRFRAWRIGEYFKSFAEQAHAAGLKAGSFVFADSLSRLVGQSAEAVSCLDTLAPMLYRRYAEPVGTACLNSEYAALYTRFAARGDRDPAESIRLLTGVRMPADSAETIRGEGFGCARIGIETAAARKSFAGTLAPILQLDDDRLDESIRSARDAGADAVGFFMWKREFVPYLDMVRS